MQSMTLDDMADILNTMQDGVTSAIAYVYADLVGTGTMSKEDAGGSLRRLAAHMRSKDHHSHVIGEGFALKFDDMALMIESAGAAEA